MKKMNRAAAKKDSLLRHACSHILWGAGTALVLFALLMMSYSLPNEKIRSHIKDASEILSLEGSYPAFYFYDTSIVADNYTDSLILSVAYAKGENPSLLENVLANPYYNSGSNDPAKDLKRLAGTDVSPNINYSRYWFGTSGAMRFLLTFFDLVSIRFFLIAAVFFSLAAAMLSASKVIGTKNAAILGAALFFTRIFNVAFCMQFAPVFIISSLSVTAVCAAKQYGCFEKALPRILIMNGVFTAFFDLLTCPLLAFGLPAAAAMIIHLKAEDKKPQKGDLFFFLVKCGLFWFISYAGMYLIKWGISSAVLSENSVEIALKSLHARMSSGGEYTSVQAIRQNLENYFGFSEITILVVITAAWIIWQTAVRKKTLSEQFPLRRLPLCLVAVSPLLWYAILPNHSCIHHWMTYRSLAVTFYAYLSWLLC